MRRYSQPAHKYLRRVWTLLPCSFKEKHAIISAFSQTVHEYILTNPIVSYEGIVAHFGDPTEVICSYFCHLDPDAFLKQRRFRNNLSIVLLTVFVVFQIVLCTASLYNKEAVNVEHMEQPNFKRQTSINSSSKASEIEKIEDHIRVLKAAQQWTDSSN